MRRSSRTAAFALADAVAADAERHGDVLPDREPRQQRGLLEHHADLGRRPVDAVAGQREDAGVGAVEARRAAAARCSCRSRTARPGRRIRRRAPIDRDGRAPAPARPTRSGRFSRCRALRSAAPSAPKRPPERRGARPHGWRHSSGLFYTAAPPRRYARIARTSKAATGRVKPFSSSSPTAAVSASVSTAVWTLPSIRIWPLLASPHSRAARFTTRPMAV